MPRWVIFTTVASTVAIAVVVGVLWYVIGGWPRDHDRHGKVAIPGGKALQLPEGEARIYFEGAVSGGGSNRTLQDPPPSLEVRIRRAGGREVRVEKISGSLFGVLSGDSGYEPYGKADVPAAGRYAVRATARGGGGQITVGPSLWNPLDSRAVGAMGAAVATLLVLLLLFELPLLAVARAQSAR